MTKKKRLIIIGGIIIILIAIVYSVYIFVIGRPFYRIEKIKKSDVVFISISGEPSKDGKHYSTELYKNEQDMAEFEKTRDMVLNLRFVKRLKPKDYDYIGEDNGKTESFTVTVLTKDGDYQNHGYYYVKGAYKKWKNKFYNVGMLEKNSIQKAAEIDTREKE